MKKTLLYLLLATVVLIAPALAAPLCVPGTLSAYQALTEGCQIGNLVFTDFGYTGTGDPGSVSANNIGVTPGVFGGDIGLEFSASWVVVDNQTMDSLVSFVVSTEDARASIRSMHLFFDGAYEGVGATEVVENYCLGADSLIPCSPPAVSGQMKVTNPPTKFNDSVFFSGVSVLAVSKDINVTVSGVGKASISQVINTFDQVPEPAAFGLAGLGLLALALRRKFSRS